MSRKRDSSTVAAVANYIDHSYADQSPKTEDEATAAPTPPPCEPASSTSSPSSYVNSDHSYHVSTSKSTKQSRAAAAAGSNGPKSKKARKSTRLASTRASSTTRTAAAASTVNTTVNDANRKGNDERNVASTVDQVTSSSTVASPHTQQQSPSPSTPAAIIPSFGDDATLSNGSIATQMSQQKPNIIPSLLTTKTETTTEHNPIQSVKSHNHARVNQMPVSQPVTQRSSSSGGGGGGHQMVNAMDEAFGRFVVSCLRGMSPTRRNNARHQIMQVLNECIDDNQL